MHIPDGFLTNGVNTPLLGAAVVAFSVAVKKVYAKLTEKAYVRKLQLATFPPIGEVSSSVRTQLSQRGQEIVLRMASLGALIFALQMVNFPIASGTSGHLMGGVLAALTLGPAAGLIVMTVVLVVQALIFGDGGIIALGANILNMGIIGTLGGYAIFRFVSPGPSRRTRDLLVGTGIAAWTSVVLAALAVAFELAISGAAPLGEVLLAMGSVHVFIGIGEALLTVAIITLLVRNRYPLALTDHENTHRDA